VYFNKYYVTNIIKEVKSLLTKNIIFKRRLLMWKFKKVKEDAKKRIKQGSNMIKTKLGEMECAINGEGSPVLISHGNGGGYDQGLEIAELYTSGEFKIIAPSRFGYLNTPIPKDRDATPMAQADAYVSLLDELKIPKVAILAVSDGGPSALQFAIRHPERCLGVIMVAAKSCTPPKDTWLQAIMFNSMLRADFLYWYMTYKYRELLLTVFGVPKEVQDKFTDDDNRMVSAVVDLMNPISYRKKGIFNDRKWMSNKTLLPQDYPLNDIKAPTLVVHAVDDILQPIFHGEYTASNIPGAQFLKLESGGHFSAGQVELVRTEVTKFLNKILVRSKETVGSMIDFRV
jgi:pimeloyl-ACP methyl ester carboxylesterase